MIRRNNCQRGSSINGWSSVGDRDLCRRRFLSGLEEEINVTLFVGSGNCD